MITEIKVRCANSTSIVEWKIISLSGFHMLQIKKYIFFFYRSQHYIPLTYWSYYPSTYLLAYPYTLSPIFIVVTDLDKYPSTDLIAHSSTYPDPCGSCLFTSYLVNRQHHMSCQKARTTTYPPTYLLTLLTTFQTATFLLIYWPTYLPAYLHTYLLTCQLPIYLPSCCRVR